MAYHHQPAYAHTTYQVSPTLGNLIDLSLYLSLLFSYCFAPLHLALLGTDKQKDQTTFSPVPLVKLRCTIHVRQAPSVALCYPTFPFSAFRLVHHHHCSSAILAFWVLLLFAPLTISYILT
jgi:hypothetical protein